MKKVLAILLTAILAIPAYAGSISRSYSAPSSRVSMGSVKPQVMQKVSPTVPVRKSQPINNYSSNYQPQYNQPQYHAPAPQPQSQGLGIAGTMAAAAAGSMIGNALTAPHGATTVVTGSGVAGAPIVAAPVASPGLVAPIQQAYVPAYSSFSFLNFFLFLLMLCGVGILVYLLFNFIKQKKETQQVADDLEKAPFNYIVKFFDIQKADAARDKEKLLNMLTQDMAVQVLSNMPEEPEKCAFSGVSSEAIHRTDREVSVRYRAYDLIDSEYLDEVWHFEKEGSNWKLAGIEEVY